MSRPVAGASFVIEHLTQLASISAWNVAINADIEVLTVFGISVSRMCGSNGLVDLFACELEKLCKRQPQHQMFTHESPKLAFGRAALLLSLIRPCTDAGLRVEDKSGRTCDGIGLTVDTVEEFITDFYIGSGKVTVLSWALSRRYRSFYQEVKSE